MADSHNLSSANVSIPEAIASEDGDRWWIEGHVTPEMAMLAVLLEQVTLVGPDGMLDMFVGGVVDLDGKRRSVEDMRADANALLRSVHHVWARPTEDEEWFDLCAEGDEDAQPFTELSL
jgi:hypothetical protein